MHAWGVKRSGERWDRIGSMQAYIPKGMLAVGSCIDEWVARPHRMTARKEGMEKKGMPAIHTDHPSTQTTDIQETYPRVAMPVRSRRVTSSKPRGAAMTRAWDGT